MKKLGGIDASFLYMETPETPMHVAGLTRIELPAGYSGSFYEDCKAHITRRLHLAPLLDPAMLLGTAYANFLSQQITMIQTIPDVWKTIANFTTRHAELYP